MAKAAKRRKSVEIYFVLYLVALVLLMPDRDLGPQNSSIDSGQRRIELYPEKIRLECKIERDSGGPVRVISNDTVNTIRYSPALTSMQVRATIEDIETGQVLSIEDTSSGSVQFASLGIEADRGVITFAWRPPMTTMTSKTFRVTIQVSGVPQGDQASSAPALGSTQFVLTTVVNDQLPPQIVLLGGGTDTLIMQDTTRRLFGEQLSAEFWMEPSRPTIMAAAGREWVTRVSLGGADPNRDLVQLPSVRVASGSMVDLVRYFEQRTLIIKGKAPLNGTSVIEVTATRSDGKQARTTFSVQTVVTATPKIPDAVYAGVELQIDPLLPSVEAAKAILRDGDREVAYTSNGMLRYTPSNLDTGKVLLFERYIDNQVDYSDKILVRSFPPPVVREIRRGSESNVKNVVVQFFAAERGSNRPRLAIIDGNAGNVRRLSGFLRPADNQRPTVSWIEVFEVTRKDLDKPFSFRVQAFDESGRASAVSTED